MTFIALAINLDIRKKLANLELENVSFKNMKGGKPCQNLKKRPI